MTGCSGSGVNTGVAEAVSPVELHFAMTEAVRKQLYALLLPDSTERMPERGVIGLLQVSQGTRRRSLLLRRLVIPAPGEVTFSWSDGLRFSPAYKSRATDDAAADRAGLVFLHTHPVHKGCETAWPAPSPEDLESDARDLFVLGRSLGGGVPLAAGIVSDTAMWSVREYRFQFPRTSEEVRDPRFQFDAGQITYCSAIRVAGPGLRKLPTAVRAEGAAGAEGAISVETQDSTVRIWGASGQRALAGLRVGHVGLGGVGGILAEHTARTGIGEGVYLEFDELTFGNLNRSQGATRADAENGVAKLVVAQRMAEAAATAPAFRAVVIDGSIVEAMSIPSLLDCDIILNAADSPWARQVLDHLAFAHLIPVVHGGTVLRGDPNTGRLQAGKSEVSATGPGHPCSECLRVYSRQDVTVAQEHPAARGRRGYVDLGARGLTAGAAASDEDVRAPSVMAFNAIVAGLMQLRMLAIALGTTPEVLIGAQRYHLQAGTMDIALTLHCRPDCPRATITALGDRYDLPTGIDHDFALARERRGGFPEYVARAAN